MSNEKVGKVVFGEEDDGGVPLINVVEVNNSKTYDWLLSGIMSHPDFEEDKVFLVNSDANGNKVIYPATIKRRPDGSIYMTYHNGTDQCKIPGAKAFAEEGWELHASLSARYIHDHAKIHELFWKANPKPGNKWKAVSLSVVSVSFNLGQKGPVVKAVVDGSGRLVNARYVTLTDTQNLHALVEDGLKLSSNYDVIHYMLESDTKNLNRSGLKLVAHENVMLDADKPRQFFKGVAYHLNHATGTYFVTTPYCNRFLNAWDKVVVGKIDIVNKKGVATYQEVFAGNILSE